MISGRIFVAAVIVGALGLTCSDQGKPTSPVSSTLSSPNLAKKPMDTTIVTQGHVKRDLQYCEDGRVAVGRIGPYGDFDHYLAQSGKFIGHNGVGAPGPLRRTYGFNASLVTTPDYQSYVDSGYAIGNLMVAVAFEYRWNTFIACPTATVFYVDEPITSWGWGMQDLIDFADSVHAHHGIFGVGEQGSLFFYNDSRLEIFNRDVLPHLDFITYTNYTDSYSNGGNDQRPTWARLHDLYGSKFDRVWIKSADDYGEYTALLSKANELGINKVLYFGGGTTQQQLESFGNTEWGLGWQRKFVHEALQMWCCTTTTYNPETCEMNSVTPTGNIVEIY